MLWFSFLPLFVGRKHENAIMMKNVIDLISGEPQAFEL